MLSIVSPVIKGKLPAEQSNQIKDFLAEMEGKLIAITIKEYKKPRSLNQNDYWFKMLTDYALPVFRDYGDNWTPFKIHEYVMNELGYQDVLFGKGGKLVVSRKESKKFNTAQWEEFMERARALLATDHGVFIPLPNEVQ